MRTFLNWLYTWAGYLAAVFMIATLAMVLASVLGRLVGFHLRGSDSYAGYAMAAAGFLALASTFARGEHIRVTLFIDRFTGTPRRTLELLSLVIALAFAVLFAWFSIKLSWQSYTLNDVSQGNDATPLWIPQISMAVGSSIFALALLDCLVCKALGKPEFAGIASDESAKNME
jgi:TRAP-type C4-dicarboxylate transport system permease small subunit